MLQTPEKLLFLILEDICKTWKWKLWVIILTQSDWKVPFNFQQIKYIPEFFGIRLPCAWFVLWIFSAWHDCYFKGNSSLLKLSSKCKDERNKPTKNITYVPLQFTSAVSLHNKKRNSVMESMSKITLNSLVLVGHENIKLRLYRPNWLEHRFERESSRKLKRRQDGWVLTPCT